MTDRTSDPRRTLRPRLPHWFAALVALPALAASAVAAGPDGAAVYAAKCASCHGPKGEGTADYPMSLVGDRPLVDLKKVIVETMPEGSPEDCVGPEAEAVARYIYDAFYSEIAQARNRPARVELARLTNRQYENAVADLLGSFDWRTVKWDAERGLKADYGKGARMVNRAKVFERVDPAVDFDYGEGSPGEDIPAEQFAVSWEGGLLAPDTGDYEFVVETPNGARLWVNGSDWRKPLIDAAVRSGDMTAHRETVRLLGGRVYPIKLEWHKSKRDKTASVRLKWKRPGHVEELVPSRNLSPHRPPEVFVVAAPFPPDDRSTGYERASNVSKEWDEATTAAAFEVADYVVANASRLAGTKDDAADRVEKLRAFGARFAERAFRRPLDADAKRLYVDRQFDEAGDPATAVKRVVLLTLKSPRFQYREIEADGLDAYEVAARLSFGLWDSLPDRPLLEAAAKGKLSKREEVVAQAERMLPDLRTKAKVREFLHRWLQLDRMHDVSKEGEAYAGFDAAVAADLRTSLDLFLEDVVWGDRPDFRRLLTSDEVYLNGRLAQFYGADLPADADFTKTAFEPDVRAGVLTHPYLMAGFAYSSTTSPIHRGVFVARSVLGRSLKPPPEAVSPTPPDLHPSLTTRERVDLQTAAAACRTCHDMINPLGFPLETFDAVGRLRKEERGKPIAADGSYLARDGKTVEFEGPKGLATFLAGSGETHRAFASHLFHHAVKQPIRAFGADRADDLTRRFAESGYDVRKLLVEVVAASAVPSSTQTAGNEKKSDQKADEKRG